ncbi:MAG TPA: CHRD domain-containing protein [Candidatus Acidoferrum sp.]|jgi:hypothetical protein
MRRILVLVLVFGVLFLARTVRADSIFTAMLNGAQEPTTSTATGFGTVILNTAQTMITVNESWSGLIGGPATATHIHCCALPGVNAGVLFPFAGVPAATSGSIPTQTFAITPIEVAELEAGLMYMNIHDVEFPGGEIRGQILPASTPEPASLGLLGLGLLLMLLCARRMRGLQAA